MAIKEEQKTEEKPVQIDRFDDLQAEFDKALLLADRGILRAMCANIIANQMKGDPVWFFIVGASSGGKSELIQAFNDITIGGRPLVVPISDLTVNAFASGQKKTGKETSLLNRIPPGGILSFKDFTSMVSKAKEAKQEIFKQLREIYDGAYVKHTGTGDSVEWTGKVGALAGATEVIYEYQEEFAAMGDRFVMYSLIQPEREKLLDFATSDEHINTDKAGTRAGLRKAVKSYMEGVFTKMHEEDLHLAPEVKENLKDVASFCTRVRSGVIVDERKSHIVKFVPSIEMPMRMLNQLFSVAKAFLIMKKVEPGKGNEAERGKLSQEEQDILYKIAFDSIPIKRRMALNALAKYTQGATTKGLAVKINYQTPVVGAWLAQLNSLGVCSREIKGGNQGDMWKLKEEFRDIMVKFEKIQVVDEALVEEEDDSGLDEFTSGPNDLGILGPEL